MPQIILLYIIAGIAAGLISGMMGLGGGIILVPILLEVFTLEGFTLNAIMHVSIATSLAVICVTSSVSLFKHYQHQHVDLGILKIIAPAAAIGAIASGWLHPYLADNFLYVLFATTLIYVGLMQFKFLPKKNLGQYFTKLKSTLPYNSKKTMDIITGFYVGAIASTLGIGGGIFLVPYLLYRGLVFKHAAGTASGCTLILAVTGTLSIFFSTLGQAKVDMPYLIGHVHLPAFLLIAFVSCFSAVLGVKLSMTLPETILKNLFGFIVLIFAVRMLYKVFY